MQYETAQKISERLKREAGEIPDTAIILGSGLGRFAAEIQQEYAVNYSEIEGFPVSTVAGHAGRLIFGSIAGKRIIAMQGRFHLYEGYTPEEVTLPERVFQLLKVKNLIVTNAAGGVNPDFKPGDLVMISDHIGLFCPSVLWGKNEARFGERFPSMSEVYSKSLQDIALAAACDEKIELKRGVYCYCRGPMYETPSEVRMLGALGADCVGMSTVPEAIAAVHGGMSVLGISCITNMAAGISGEPISHSEVMETGAAVGEKFSRLIKAVVARL